MIDKAKLKREIEDYTGKDIKTLECVPDPQSPGYIAIRAIFLDNYEVHLIYNSNSPDPIDEVEFSEWPPTSNSKNMFKLENMNVSFG